MLEYNLIKQHRPRFNVRLRDDKSYPFLAVTLDDEWPRPMVMRGAQAQGRPLLRALRARLRHPRDPRPAAAHLPAPHLLGQQVRPPPPARAGPACCSTSRSARARASARSTSDDLPADDHRAARLPRRRDRRRRRPPGSRDGRGQPTSSSSRRRPGSATGSRACARPSKQQMVGDRSEDLDVIGLAEDDLEAAVQVFFVRKGRVVGRKGFIVDKVEDLSPGELIEHVLEGLYDDPPLGHPQAGPGADDARRRRALRGVPAASCGSRGSRSRCRSGARSAAPGDRGPQRQGGLRPPPAQAGQRPQQPGPGPQRAPGVPRSARGAAAHRVLRHVPHPGHRLRGLDGGHRGRPAQEVGVPAVQDQGGRRQRRLRRHGGGPHAAGSPPTSSSGRSRWGSGPASSPTRPSSCSSTAARASCRAP